MGVPTMVRRAHGSRSRRPTGAQRALALLLALGGCGESDGIGTGPEPEPEPESCLAPNRLVDGACREPGVQDDGCPAGSWLTDGGSCEAAGVPPQACATGFLPTDRGGCEPVLPAAPCPAGLMAVPGDAACREIMACGADRWGEIPVDPDTVYVDQSYDQGAGPSDGTESRPYSTVGEAVAAAPAGGLIAIAAGSYVEDVRIRGKPLRLWGKCPAEVELVGTGDSIATVYIRGGASGSELAGLAIRGPTIGVVATGSEDLQMHGLWVHDNPSRGIDIENTLGSTSATLSSSLIEHNGVAGVLVIGSDVEIDAVDVRDTLSLASGNGLGVSIQDDTDGPRSTALLRASLIEQNHEIGVFVLGSDAELEGLVVRDTLPRHSDQTHGIGVAIQRHGETGASSNAVLRASLVERSHDLGVLVGGSDAQLDAVVIRDTLPRESDQSGGCGVGIQDGLETATTSHALLRASLIEQNHLLGIYVAGSEVELQGVVIRDTLPRASDQKFGCGMNVKDVDGAPSRAVLGGSLIEGNHEYGLAVVNSEAQLTGVSLVATSGRASDGLFGDGVVVPSEPMETRVELSSCRIADNVRAGLSVFGATARIRASSLSCNMLQLVAETYEGRNVELTDGGFNRCACGDEEPPCAALSVGLAPPEIVDAGE